MPLTEFTFNDELEITKCPNQKEPIRSDYNNKKKVSTSHFSKDDCSDCPLKESCRVKSQVKSNVLRVSKKTILASEV